MLRRVIHERFKVGQIWGYATRPFETGSTLMIVRTDQDDRLGSIVHICVDGLRMKNPHHFLGLSSDIGHLPCSGAAINQSVTELRQENVALPDFEEGYDEWRAAFDAGQAGVWTASVAEIVAAMEMGLNQSESRGEDAVSGPDTDAAGESHS